MLDVHCWDGRARTATWTVGSKTVSAPGLVWTDVDLASPPAWVQAAVTVRPNTQPHSRQVVELVSPGTHFHPIHHAGEDLAGALPLPAAAPAPSTKVQTLMAGPELAILHDAAGWASNPKNFPAALKQAREEATSGRLLWAPGLGTPADYALWVHLGIDLFDSSPLLLAATRGQALTADGPLSAAEAAKVYGNSDVPFDTDQLVAFNLESARTELAAVALAIRQGRLRSLVERRIYSRASTVEVLRRMDREHHYLEAAAPHHRDVPLPAMTQEAVWMPEVEAYRRRLQGPYEPPQLPILLLLPCSQGKPYKVSRSHRAMARALDDTGIRAFVHEVMVTSPLGLVPREVEEVYPAQAYDIPVTGHWSADEEEIVRTQLAALLDKGSYSHVVVHLGQATFDAVRDLLPPDTTRHTCLKHPTSPEDLERLKAELLRLKAQLAAAGPAAPHAQATASGTGEGPAAHVPASLEPRRLGRDRKLADVRALLSFQFNAAVAATLTEGATTHGRMPYVRLDREGVQLGTTTPDRGVVSLTLEGAQALVAHRTKRVMIGDFTPKGTSTLFAIGVVGADPDVRAGDEVAIVRASDPGTLVGCGVAAMHGEAMVSLQRGVAAALRHLVKAGKPQQPALAPDALEVSL